MEFQDLSIGEKFIMIYKGEIAQNITEEKEVFVKTKEVDRDKKEPGEAVRLSDGELIGVNYHTPVIRIKV